MDFKEATDILTKRITADEIADAAGVSHSSIARARLEPGGSAYRSPPDGWQRVIVQLARARCTELEKLASALSESVG